MIKQSFVATIGLGLVISVSGCASTQSVSDTAVRTNYVQEQAHNELILLNIVRAYERMPMHFTQVSAVRLPVGFGNVNLGLPISFGADRTHSYTLSSTLSVSQSVDTVVLNSQEFIRGITTPVPPKILLYYLDQGWPQQLILHMFIRSVEFFDTNKNLTKRVENYPENRDEFQRFQSLMEKLKDCEIDGSQEAQHIFYTATLKDSELNDIKAVAAASQAGLIPVRVNSDGKATDTGAVGVRFASETKSSSLRLVDRPNAHLLKPARPCVGLLAEGEENSSQEANDGEKRAQSRIKKLETDALKPLQMSARIILRSPEAMLYYLGEITRARLHGQFSDSSRARVSTDPNFPLISYRHPRGIAQDAEQVTLFQMNEGPTQDSAISVNFSGKIFSVPSSSESNRSMHVISLVSQIIALQNKGTDVPATTTLRILPP